MPALHRTKCTLLMAKQALYPVISIRISGYDWALLEVLDFIEIQEIKLGHGGSCRIINVTYFLIGITIYIDILENLLGLKII